MTQAERRPRYERSNAREQLPRALVGRRRQPFLELFEMENPPKFSVGDMLKFQKVDGSVSYLTILGFKPDGTVESMFYDGRPHYFTCVDTDLDALRVLEVETMSAEDVASYREALSLEPHETIGRLALSTVGNKLRLGAFWSMVPAVAS